MSPRTLACKEYCFCIKCGKQAEVKYRKQWYCGSCLNPDPTRAYLKMERERANGQWGGVNTEAWGKV